MPLATTVIGSWPKPAYLAIPDWFSDEGNFTEPEQAGFSGMGGGYDPRSKERAVKVAGPELEATVRRAVTEVLQEQADLGLGVVTDGEMERGAYYMQVMTDIEGIDMVQLEEKVMRSGAYSTKVPAVRGPVAARLHLSCPREWTRTRELAPPGLGVKFTIPGPMTIADGVKNLHYEDTSQLHRDLARALNHEMLALVAHGCSHIQVSGPTRPNLRPRWTSLC
jgi:5-methyltetrahydropteroyltriglutamate--homocysteine methyltransferase